MSMRTAFDLWPALDHRSKSSKISSVAVSEDARILYLGLSDGQIEEHSIVCSQHGVRTSLRARKHIGKKPVQDICHLHSAHRLALVCDGQLLLLDQESLEGHSIPNIKAVSAMAVSPWAQYPPRIAVAMRANKRNARVMVYEVLVGADAGSPFGSSALCVSQANIVESLTIKSMAWLGQKVVLCTSLRYMLLQPTQGTSTQLFALAEEAPSPTLVQSIPSANLAVLLMDEVGVVINDSGQPAQSALTFPSTPIALAASGLYILAACTDGVHVYDRTSASWVQSLPYPPGVTPSPGQSIITAYNNKGSCVLFSGLQKVMLFQPIALDEQAKDLLRAGQYEQALNLANVCAADGAPWAETAFAQTALMLLHELRFEDAMRILPQCSLSLFQPMELFPLFPSITAPWADQLPRKGYWGMHRPLQPLDALLAGEAQPQTRTLLEQEAMQSIAEYLLEVREREGVDAADGIDTLLVYLLAELDDDSRLASFAEGPQKVTPDVVAGLLQRKGQSDTLAQLYAAAGQPAAGLALWKEIADENQGAEGERLKRQQSAVQRATKVLLNRHAAPTAVVLTYLPWLISASPKHALSVLKTREVDDETGLKLVRGDGGSPDLLWRYLDYLVCQQGSSQAALHTELALTLADVALHLLPPPQTSGGDVEASPASNQGHQAAVNQTGSPALAEVQGRLRSFLKQSSRYDARLVLARIRGTPLWQEQVILHSKVGDDTAALRILAIELEDMVEAERYCAEQGLKGGQATHALLLHMLLHPGQGRPPMFAQACHLLAAQGADLDPLQVLGALSEEMPLSAGVDILSHLLCERLHRRRQGSIVRSLHKACTLSASVDRAELFSRRAVTSEERACAMCHTRIGSKIFAVYPDGTLVCYRCYKKSEPNVCLVTGRDFQGSPAKSSERWPD